MGKRKTLERSEAWERLSNVTPTVRSTVAVKLGCITLYDMPKAWNFPPASPSPIHHSLKLRFWLYTLPTKLIMRLTIA